MAILVHGFGRNDLGFGNATKNELYAYWKRIVLRSCCKKYKRKYVHYKDTKIAPEWLTASVFIAWASLQEWEGRQIDKDILYPDKNIYSPETCTFVLPATNNFVLARERGRGDYPLGCCEIKGSDKFQAYCGNPFSKKQENLGTFKTPQEAHEAWRKRKHELAQLVAETEIDPRIIEALKIRYSEVEWYGKYSKILN